MDARPLISGLLLVTTLLAGAASRAADATVAPPARTIVLAADKWCPVNCSATSGPPGYAVELARAAFALAGRELEYRVMPWERAVEAAREGRIDGIIGAVAESAPGFVYPKETIGHNTNVFFVRSDRTWRYRGIHSLETVVVGMASQYKFGEPFDSYVARYGDDPRRITTIYSLEPVPQGMRLLQAGRIDAFLDDRMVVNWAMLRDPTLAGARESGTLNDIPLYIAFSPARKETRELADLFDERVRELRASGKLAPILARYGVSDWVGIDPGR